MCSQTGSSKFVDQLQSENSFRRRLRTVSFSVDELFDNTQVAGQWKSKEDKNYYAVQVNKNREWERVTVTEVSVHSSKPGGRKRGRDVPGPSIEPDSQTSSS